MKTFLESKGLYLLAISGILTIAILFSVGSPASSVSNTQTHQVGPKKAPSTSTNIRRVTTTEPASSAAKNEARHDVDYDVADALDAFEEKLSKEDHNLSKSEMKSVQQLITNLTEAASKEAK